MLRRRRRETGTAFPGFDAPVAEPRPRPPRLVVPPVPHESHESPPSERWQAVGVDGEPEPFTVRVVRSARRTRTVGAALTGAVLTVTVPATMTATEVERWSSEMRRRFLRKMSTATVDLPARAEALSRRHDLPRAREIRWAEMTTRWGSCTTGTASIRLSTRLASFPDWVLDYVIVHELAHIEVPNHSPKFWRVVERYPKSERARGYLIAKSGDDADAD
jgi:predicted metal-dependent hydrolase